jgi:hypothetical protein
MGVVPILMLAILAQTSPSGTNAQDRARAQGLLAEGATLYGRGDYLGALNRFNAAYAAYPSSKIWFNIGQANKALGRPVEAHEAYQKFLREVPNASPEDKADAQTSLAQLRGWLGQLTVVCDTTGAEISVDGKAVGNAPLDHLLWVTPGRHQVTAVRADGCPMVENAEVAVGSNTTVTLKPLHGPLVAAAPSLDLEKSRGPKAGGGGWWLGRTWTWVAAGATVALTGAAAAVGYSMKSRFDDLRSSCGHGSPEQLGCSTSDIQSVRDRKLVANILWAAAGAAAVTTGILFFVEGRPVAVAPLAGETTGLLARVEF